MAEAGLHRTIPAFPVRDVRAAVAYYRERFGFQPRTRRTTSRSSRATTRSCTCGARPTSEWRPAPDLRERPICSGAESFLAGTASCRIEVTDVDALYAELEATGVLHPYRAAASTTTDFGTREFATLDLDGNLVTFFRWI